MALADTAKLAVDLSLTGNFTSGLSKAQSQLGKFDTAVATSVSKAERLGQGIGTGIKNIAKIGAVAAAGISAFVISGVQDLATLEDAQSKVAGAIKATGKQYSVTAAQISDWSNQIEASVQAAFDDKEITAATATLIRYGNVSATNLRPAMVVMTDLAARTGDVASASNILAKALADPVKGMTALRRAGVVLTKAQEDQIKALDKAGKKEQEQALLLDILSKKTKGAAAATAGPYRDALNELRDASEDARKALAIGFLPIIERVASWLHKKLADPKVIDQIKGFGKTLADSFDKLLTIVGKIPWDSVANAMKLAGTASKAILDAFVAMPAWVQTAVITGWGLNKLTGGALTDIFGSLASGLIKGILHMNAGVVNIQAGVVNGTGGAGDVAGSAAKGLGLTGALAFIAPLAVAAVTPLAITAALFAINGGAAGIENKAFAGRQDTARARGLNPNNVARSTGNGPRANALTNGDVRHYGAVTVRDPQLTNQVQANAILDRGGREKGFNVLAGKMRDADESIRQAVKDNTRALTAGERHSQSWVARQLKSSNSLNDKLALLKRVEERYAARGDTKLQAITKQKIDQLKSSEAARLAKVRDAIERKKLSVQVQTKVNVSTTVNSRGLIKATSTYSRYYGQTVVNQLRGNAG